MGVTDAMNYILFANPISSNASSAAWMAATTLKDYLLPKQHISQIMLPVPLWKLASSAGPYIKLSAISGALAVVLGAYGSHKKDLQNDSSRRRLFDTGSRYHFYHTFALMGLPMCRYPFVASTFFVSGILLFSGTLYYAAMTDDHRYNKLTPFGGVCFVIGWLSMCL